MKKCLILSFLICMVLSSWLRAEITYLVSPEGEEISNYHLRAKHPINDVIHYGDLEEKLYMGDRYCEEIKYNFSNIEEIKDVLEKLKLIAKKSQLFHTKVEEDALRHIFVAGISFLKGENGLPKDYSQGKDLLRFYFEERYLPELHRFKEFMGELEKPSYDPNTFIEKIKKIAQKKTQEPKKECLVFSGCNSAY